MFRGHYTARVDDRGRVRLPGAFLSHMRENGWENIFITSLDGGFLRVYPMPAWEKIEQRLLGIPSLSPSRARLLDRLTFFGQESSLDKVGRILIPQRLRESAKLTEEVSVLGYLEYLEVWNPRVFQDKLQKEKLTEEDRSLLSDLGI